MQVTITINDGKTTARVTISCDDDEGADSWLNHFLDIHHQWQIHHFRKLITVTPNEPPKAEPAPESAAESEFKFKIGQRVRTTKEHAAIRYGGILEGIVDRMEPCPMKKNANRVWFKGHPGWFYENQLEAVPSC